MDFWSQNFRRYFGDLAQFLKLIDRYKTPKDLEKLADRPEFQAWAMGVAERMAGRSYTSNAKSWRDAAAKSGKGRLIFRNLQKELAGTNVGAAVQGIVLTNADLIKSLPLDLAQRAAAFTQKQQMAGMRSSQIAKLMKEWLPGVSESRLKLLARTQVSASETALTRARSEQIGIHTWQWSSSKDSRVRPSHRFMEGAVCTWSSPPNPELLIGVKSYGPAYPAGATYSCRCVCLPVIDAAELSFPIRFIEGTTVRKLTRAQFSKLLKQKAA